MWHCLSPARHRQRGKGDDQQKSVLEHSPLPPGRSRPMTLYELRGVSHRYNLDGQRVQALHGIDLVVRKGEFMAIAGPSGSGKTTLLNVLGLLEPPCEGTVLFDGADVSRVSERERTLLRRERLGFIFQTFNLIPVLSAYENVE